MTYKRKTHTEWDVQGYYGQGWEDVTTEETYREARERFREYRENEPNYRFRIRCRSRVPNEVTA